MENKIQLTTPLIEIAANEVYDYGKRFKKTIAAMADLEPPIRTLADLIDAEPTRLVLELNVSSTILEDLQSLLIDNLTEIGVKVPLKWDDHVEYLAGEPQVLSDDQIREALRRIECYLNETRDDLFSLQQHFAQQLRLKANL